MFNRGITVCHIQSSQQVTIISRKMSTVCRDMRNICLIIISALLSIASYGCMSREDDEFVLPGGDFAVTSPHGLLIVNEGNFQYGNSSLSYYDPTDMKVTNELFQKVNGMRLGDVAQSMTVYEGTGWIVGNNSHVIFAVDIKTLREKGRITDLTSPRYIHFVNNRKAYVTQLWDNRIYIVDPATYSVTGTITVDGMQQQSGSTERMVQIGEYVYVTCWSYQRDLLKIDSSTDRITDRLDVGFQPGPLVKDFAGNLWTITDGGYSGSPAGSGIPALVCIDPESMTVIRRLEFKQGSSPRQLATDSSGHTLYFINQDLYEMDADDSSLPVKPLVSGDNRLFYALSVDPVNGDIYLSDAIDYTQQGVVYRFSPDGVQTDKFYAGVNPACFCWIP